MPLFIILCLAYKRKPPTHITNFYSGLLDPILILKKTNNVNDID